MTHPARLETLADLRVEIDCIDSELHQLLIKRGEIIHRLIEAKARAKGGGSAFRPAREADMMRGLVARHQRPLPLDTVESIWRIIISTFTYVQSPYSVHADISGGDGAMRDCCRFHFGFTVPYVPHQGAKSVIAAVAGSQATLGLSGSRPTPAPGGARLTAARAQNHRPPAFRRAARPSGRHAAVCRRPAARRGSRARCLPLWRHADGWTGNLPYHLARRQRRYRQRRAARAQNSLLVSADGAVAPACGCARR